ncbi:MULTISPECIES: hypothetical protein [Niveibacterium]|uniref:Uncharacterized protein n=1 Tax=Niveibacterium microcysteis TaxID=2811415 RepID=A0ABX7M8Z1_9RHOO|nr:MULTISPECIES: hypothetical protein [Niveibacterium]QSI77628.1 hypothetical protein JY500_02930 [Niveibacterium microcysteis]
MSATLPLPCAGRCRHFAPESSHCHLHGKGIEAPFEQRCDHHEVMESFSVSSNLSLLDGLDLDRG